MVNIDMPVLSASLVLFHTKPELYVPAIQSFLDGLKNGFLIVLDNSAEPTTHPIFNNPCVHYIFHGRNVGFGAGHNIAFSHCYGKSDFHLVLNPDVEFENPVLPSLTALLKTNAEISAVMPRIIYPDGSMQQLCKLLPTPADLLIRRFIPSPFKTIVEHLNQRYELHGLRQDRLSDVPVLSGCFLLVRTRLLEQLGGFDERYFMYMEDVDLIRRLNKLGRIVYMPLVTVSHVYAKESYRNRRLLMYHLKSAIKYFNKWGWFFDKERRSRNQTALMLLKISKEEIIYFPEIRAKDSSKSAEFGRNAKSNDENALIE